MAAADVTRELSKVVKHELRPGGWDHARHVAYAALGSLLASLLKWGVSELLG